MKTDNQITCVMRKLLYLLTSCWALLGLHGAHGQTPAGAPSSSTTIPPGYWLGIEPFMVHTAPYVGPFGTTNLTGQTTYRIYLHTNGATDFLSSISGEAANPLTLNSTSTPAWHNDLAFGANFGSLINGAFFGFMPALQYDSWLTIGASQSVTGYTLSETNVVTPWTQFNAGQLSLIHI